MADRFEEWVIIELLGHRRLAGYLTEQQLAGAGFLRLDIPGDKACEECRGEGVSVQAEPDGLAQNAEVPCSACHGLGDELVASQLYSPSSVYCITPTTEVTARQVARLSRPAPVQRWELLTPPRVAAPDVDTDGFDYEKGPF